MPQINLLPWREELRKRRLKEFLIVGAVAMMLAAGAVVGVHLYYEGRIEFQVKRNALLKDEIVKLDKKIAEIKEIEREKELLLARMRIIEQLQTSRPEIVKVMDQLVKTLPEGVFYTSIAQKGRSFNLDGVAQSNARVSSLMRSLDDSQEFTNPVLLEIKAQNAPSNLRDVRLASFKLRVSQKAAAELEGAAVSGAARGGTNVARK